MDSNHEILILYGSQTGMAKEISETLARELLYRQFSIQIFAMDDYDIKNLPNEKFILFVVSTTGQGDPPDNMKKFWKFLLIKDIPKNALEGVNFSIFGLGDSGYQKFNAMARKLYQRLIQIGAKEFHEKGLGDEQNEFGIDAEFVPWLKKLWDNLKNYFPEKEYNVNTEKIHPLTRYIITKLDKKDWENYKSLSDFKPSTHINLKLGKLKSNVEMTGKNPVRKVMYLTVETLDKSDLIYHPGDVAAILPRNDPEMCKKLAELLGYKYDDVINISLKENASSTQNYFPKDISIHELFEYWLKLSESPSRYFFHVLSFFTNDEQHSEKLREIGQNTNEGKNAYNQYCTKEKRNVYEILFDFHTVNLPLEYLLEVISLQKFREYSISTSNKINSKSFGLTIALTDYLTPFKRQITGVCSGWFDKSIEGEIIPFYLKKGTLPYPNDPNIPVICIGPGTGIAPHISFLQERFSNNIEEYNPQNTIVVFGNRNKNVDFLHELYLTSLAKEKKIYLLSAFSRDQSNKVYTYHIIKDNSELFTNLILNNMEKICIFVCGSAKKMPKFIEDTFIEILSNKIGSEEAKTIIANLIKKKQYVVEAW